jgi:Fe2+ or Zn2+ uptake regulation protein
MMQNSYYNTNQEEGEVLSESIAKAISQEERLIKTFKKAGRKLTANDVHNLWIAEDQAAGIMPPLLTSVRRALTNLANNHVIVKLKSGMKPGPYGKKVHYYALANTADALQLELW